MDTNDTALFDSAFTQDARWDLSGRVMEGLKAIHTECFDATIIKLDTTHYVTNIRINVTDEGSEASISALYHAKHYRGGTGMVPGLPWFMTGGVYFLDLVKVDVDGLWKIKFFKMNKMWTEGDYSVMGHD
ncbi:hypothetical protein K432DRAFT_410809 [Lepidopterella palustris CBS 459.81]|uniref:SnoaL-like domain-containing protein n=1 Tax=Lepidopterella palustris CBS 459.81 TaxID=1314670 RepID=A0A8E2DX17_9PEZI|nr:hypothetical protein K432DRAFT_410809 [Lepidopterella palustris CBS 459.81]